MAALCVLKAVQQIQLRFWRHKMVKNIKEAEDADAAIDIIQKAIDNYIDNYCK